jgi:hypothetical protein
MPRPRNYVGPTWPPAINAYDYVLELCPSDLAWEFLRRNLHYQRDYRLSRRGWHQPRRLRTGHQITRIRRHTPRSVIWGLHPFCGSGAAGSRNSHLLAHKPCCSNPRGRLRQASRWGAAPHLSGRSPVRKRRHCRTRSRGKSHPPRLRLRPHPTVPWLPRIPRAGWHHILGRGNSRSLKVGGRLRRSRHPSPFAPL